jgi:hypothetical protein
MNGDVSFDVGSAIPYLVDSLKSLFGKDSLSVSARHRFEHLSKISIDIASHVQCIGMWKPIPISKIYQQTRLYDSPVYNNEEEIKYIEISRIIENDENIVVTAGPGDGKTVFTHWIFMHLINVKKYTPMLFTLRLPDSISSLEIFIEDLKNVKYFSTKNTKIILLIDGYDEVGKKDREKISGILRVFRSLRIGKFILTCRSHYELFDLQASQYWIAKFNKNDALGFCENFMQAYGVETDIPAMLLELERKGFKSFTEHPLMLALVCILRSTPRLGLPRSSLGLIRRAIDTLTLRWDDSKGIVRDSAMPLDGEERVRCLMRIAYELDKLVGPESIILGSIMKHLKRQQVGGVDARKLLKELSQWYGLLVPVSLEDWTFTHRTIHDFLAARFWVESGEFSLNTIQSWDTRAAYAMCTVPDATRFIQRALSCDCEMHVFNQCLFNKAIFDTNEVAGSIIAYFSRKKNVFHKRSAKCMSVKMLPSDDFFNDASVEFLESMIFTAINYKNKNEASNTIIAYSLYELFIRKLSINRDLYGQALQYFGNHNFLINIQKGKYQKELILYQVSNNDDAEC